MDWQFLIPSLIGGLIGYITNDIAIKMLFRPRNPVYIGKWQLPFTPGLIPKERHRIAESIGNVISTQLLNSDTLTEAFTSEDMLLKIRTSLEDLVENNRENQETVADVVMKFAPEEEVNQTVDYAIHEASAMIQRKIRDFHLGEMISKIVLQKINEKMETLTLGIMTNFLDEGLTNSISSTIGEMVDRTISDNSEEIIEQMLKKEVTKFQDTSIGEMIEKYDEKIPGWIDFIVGTYEKIMQNSLAKILKGVDIAKIVEEKIDSFDAVQLEAMIFGIMKRELKAIVYLGALLGFIMGWINVLI